MRLTLGSLGGGGGGGGSSFLSLTSPNRNLKSGFECSTLREVCPNTTSPIPPEPLNPNPHPTCRGLGFLGFRV